LAFANASPSTGCQTFTGIRIDGHAATSTAVMERDGARLHGRRSDLRARSANGTLAATHIAASEREAADPIENVTRNHGRSRAAVPGDTR
jgi:hypothetical protein